MRVSTFSGGVQLAVVTVLLLAGCGGGGSGGGNQSSAPVGMTPMPKPLPPVPTPPAPTPEPMPSPPPDIEPDAFGFATLANVTPDSLVTFDAIQIPAVNQPVAVWVTAADEALDQ